MAGCLEHLVHLLELLLPETYLVLDLEPFLSLDLAQLVRLDYNFLLLLVDLGVDNLCGNSFDGPLLNLISCNVEQSRQVSVLEVSLVSRQRADLHIRLLKDHFFNCKALVSHQFREGAQCFFKELGISVGEQIQELEHFLLFLLDQRVRLYDRGTYTFKSFDGLEVEKLLKVDDTRGLNCQNDATTGLSLDLSHIDLVFISLELA